MFAAKLAYSAAIQFLANQATGIPITTPAALKPFLPHLTEAEIKALIKKANRQQCNYGLALPALVVKDTILIARIEPGKSGRGKKPARLKYVYAKRVGESGDVVSYTTRATAYARKHWGNTLIADTWTSIIRAEVQNPKELTDGELCTNLTLYFVTAREWNDIRNDRSGPTSVLVDQSTVFVTHLATEAAELRGGRADYSDYNCFHCGGGLGAGNCTSCGSRFKDGELRSFCGTPLPQKLVDYANRLGFRFAIDPALARAAEQGAWEFSVADEERQQAARERQRLEALLGPVKQKEQNALAAASAADQRWTAGKAALGSAVTAFDKTVRTGHENRKAARRQKDGQRRQRQRAEAAAPAASKSSKKVTGASKKLSS